MSIHDIPTAVAGAAIPPNTLVRFTAANTVGLNPAGGEADGVFEGVSLSGVSGATAAADSRVAVTSRNAPGRFKLTAAGAIPVNTLVYPAANGQVSATRAGKAVGIARQSASGAGSVIDVDLFARAGGPRVLFDGAATGAASNAVTIDIGVDVPRPRLRVTVRSNAGLSREPITVTKPGATTVTLASSTLAATDEVLIELIE